MKKENLWILIAFLSLSIGLLVACSKFDEEAIGPEITFADGIKETTARSGNVSVTISSSIGLKEIIIDKLVDNKVDEIIVSVTEFENPKRYAFTQDFTVSEQTLIRVTAYDTKNQRSIDSFTFNPR